MANEKNQHSHGPTLKQALISLKASRLKATPGRKAILQALVKEHGPFTAEEIHKRISRKSCDLATVYRCLSSLEAARILRRCEFGDGSARYELTEGDHSHHHHLVCNKCRRVEIVDECELGEIGRFAQKRGYSEVSHILEFFGTCPDCK